MGILGLWGDAPILLLLLCLVLCTHRLYLFLAQVKTDIPFFGSYPFLNPVLFRDEQQAMAIAATEDVSEGVYFIRCLLVSLLVCCSDRVLLFYSVFLIVEKV